MMKFAARALVLCVGLAVGCGSGNEPSRPDANQTGGQAGGGRGGQGGKAGQGGAAGRDEVVPDADAGGAGGSKFDARPSDGGGTGGTTAHDGGTDASSDGAPPLPAATSVIMRGYDLQRTGANITETTLTPASITPSGFGKLGCHPVDDEVYGQILYMPNVDMGAKGKHNVAYVVTVNDTVYALDVDDLKAPSLWEARYADPAKSIVPVPTADLARTTCVNYKDVSRQVGIVSTPAVDPDAMTMYVLARTKEPGNKYPQKLHAINMLDGSERSGSPVEITAIVAGSGAGSVGGMISFDPLRQNQRSGLLLLNGVVYIAWASHCDEGPYHGWVLGYDAKTLKQVVVYNDTINGAGGGIWMAGMAPAVDDAGNIYLVTGNGSADLMSLGPNRGESFMRLKRNGGGLEVSDWFTPANYQTLENEDRDLGSGGAMLIPGTQLILGGNKDGKIYVLDRGNMGKFRSTDNNQIIQTIAVTGAGRAHIHGTPSFWKSSAGDFIYVMGEEDYLKQYKLDGTQLTLFKMSATRAPLEPGTHPGSYTMPGGVTTVTANGTDPTSGIVWVSVPVDKDANQAVVAGVLRAFDASDVSKELWNSQQNAARDSFGNYAKFNPPTAVGGRVLMPTFSKQICVYGKLN